MAIGIGMFTPSTDQVKTNRRLLNIMERELVYNISNMTRELDVHGIAGFTADSVLLYVICSIYM